MEIVEKIGEFLTTDIIGTFSPVEIFAYGVVAFIAYKMIAGRTRSQIKRLGIDL